MKSDSSPVLGGKLGTCFDVARLKEGDKFRLGFSWRPKASVALTESPDGKAWMRVSDKPVLAPEKPWEKVALMCPHVIWDEAAREFCMWYSGGEQYEPDAIGCATSPDGKTWTKHAANPIIRPGENQWDHDACYKPFAIFDGGRWLLWYNGRRGNVEQIGLAIHEGEDLGFE
ncbi:MAG: hypothetical protein WBD75_08175 [Phycisphaerae bacterium]